MSQEKLSIRSGKGKAEPWLLVRLCGRTKGKEVIEMGMEKQGRCGRKTRCVHVAYMGRNFVPVKVRRVVDNKTANGLFRADGTGEGRGVRRGGTRERGRAERRKEMVPERNGMIDQA